MTAESIHQRWRLDLLRDAAVLSGGVMAAGLALLLLVRRVIGDWQPLPALMLLGAGVVLVTYAQLWRLGWRASREGSEPAWRTWLGRVAPRVVLFIYASALTIAGTNIFALLLFWLLLVGTELWVSRTYRMPIVRQLSTGTSMSLPAATAEVEISKEIEVDEEEPDELLPQGVSQQLTRQSVNDVETLTCLIRINFALGAQTQTVHIAFCPPLEGELTTRCEHVDGAACEIKVSLVESFGARLEVKRRGPLTLEDEAVVLLEVCGAVES